jgi:hypothetical protein
MAQFLFCLAPMLGVCIVGAVFATLHRRQAPRAAALVFVGAGLIAFSLVMQWIGIAWLLPGRMQGWSEEEIVMAFTVAGFICSVIDAGGILLLILAAFTGRRREG